MAPVPPTEKERLQALHEYQILDTEPEEAFDELTRLAALICDTPITLVTLLDQKRQWFKSKVGLPISETPRDVAFCSHAILQTGPFVVADALKDQRFANNPLVTGDPNIRFYAGVPLTTQEGHGLGTLCVIDRKPRELSEKQMDALNILSRQVMARIELRHRVRQLELTIRERDAAQEELHEIQKRLLTLSITDELTGLHNRRAFEDRLDEDSKLAIRHSWPLSLLMIDVDSFKAYNDSFGHPAGDEVLKTIAKLMKKTMRATDFGSRHGGEEFAAILQNNGATGAAIFAERFRKSVEEYPWEHRKITVSIGISTATPHQRDNVGLVSLADQALYRAKNNGRNSVFHSDNL